MREQIFSLVVEISPSSTACYLLKSSLVTLGRSQDNMVVVQEPTVSGRHAEIRERDGRFEIKDLGSSNGTTLNGEKLGRDAVQLRHGDILTFGFSVKAKFVRAVEVVEVAPDYPRTIIPENRAPSPVKRLAEPENQPEPVKKVAPHEKQAPQKDLDEDDPESYEPTINPVAAAMAKAGKFI